MDKEVVEFVEITRYSDLEIQKANHFDKDYENEDGTYGRWFNDIRAMLIVMPEMKNFKYRIHTRNFETGEVIIYRKKVKDNNGIIYNVFQDYCLIN